MFSLLPLTAASLQHGRMPKPLRGGLWSATPTPFDTNYCLDVDSVPRLVAHHLRLGVSGLMLAGTTGEGAWMQDRDRERLTRTTVSAAAARITVALQVTDNSALRTLDNIDRAAEWGADVAFVEAPYFLLNATPVRLTSYYREIARRSALPLGIYDRGANSAYCLPQSSLLDLLAEPNVVMIKDSSGHAARRGLYLQARHLRPELLLLSGDEFDCVSYLRSGYDGLLLGGGIFNAALASRIIAAMQAGSHEKAAALQHRMNDLMLRVYGGPKIECWLSGLKELLVQMGIFSTNANLLEYPLTDDCRMQIRAAVTGADGMGFRADLFGHEKSDETQDISAPDLKPTLN
jgi:dihydrodipicolinate synthase/N-acetylneuraminate lyase